MKPSGAIIALIVVLAVPMLAAAGTAKKGEDALRAVEEVYAYGGSDEEGVRTLARTASAAIQSGVSAEEIEVFIREAARTHRSPKEVAAYIEIASTLHSEGVPPGLVFDAGLEGFARGVLETEMRRSIDALQSRLFFCRTIARRHTGRGKEVGSAGDMLIRALCYTMNMGLTEDEIAALGAAAENSGLDERAFFNVLRTSMELIGLGMDPGRVSALMVRAISNGVGVQEVVGLPAFVQAERENGFTDDDIYKGLLGKIDEAAAGGKHPSGDGNGIGTPGAGSAGRGGTSGGGTSAGGNPGGRK
ncbi:MAG: hypothetical protein JXQ30_10355 [Spirochaetes bacterium]|nr:hypothetical protein [Spirochaetota bacterium]